MYNIYIYMDIYIYMYVYTHMYIMQVYIPTSGFVGHVGLRKHICLQSLDCGV